jgi:hypothetical protein
LASLSVTVAAYGTLEASLADWNDVARDQNVERNHIDAVLIERCEGRVVNVHRSSSRGWAQGSVASALVALLAPPALLDGAIAGGVGKRALTFVAERLSRDAVNELGRVLESGRFVTLALTERGPGPATATYGARALSLANLPMRGTAFDLRLAVDADDDDE